MLSQSLDLLLVLVLIIANGALSMSEIAIISARKERLQQWAETGNAKAKAALRLANSPNLFLAAVQVGITLVGVLSGVFGGFKIANDLADWLSLIPTLAPYSHGLAMSIVVLAISFLSLLIGELVPKRLALNNPERIAALVSPAMNLILSIASPAVRFLSASTDLVLRMVGMKASTAPPITEEEIKLLISQGTLAGVFDEAEQEMVERVFRLSDRRVGVLMTPRKRVTWLNLNDPPDKIRRLIGKNAYSCFPVCQGRLNTILGIVHVRDLLIRTLAGRPLNLKASLKQPLFVLETTRVPKVLEMFKESGTHMAMIIDEYGTIEGLVTLTNILEAVVGDLPSVDDREEPKVVQRDDGSWLVDGLLPVDELKEMFRIQDLPEEKAGHYQTLGGFAMTHLKRVPSTGDRFECCGLRFEILDMDGHRVDKVLIEQLAQPPPDDAE
jgi:putative hemolysin